VKALITWAQRLRRRRRFIELEAGGFLLLEDGVTFFKLE
jgi:hypothetical protein